MAAKNAFRLICTRIFKNAIFGVMLHKILKKNVISLVDYNENNTDRVGIFDELLKNEMKFAYDN